MLRKFLVLQALIGRMLVICLVLAAFLLPFGFTIVGLPELIPELFPNGMPQEVAYVPSAIPLALLAFVVLWTFLSLFSLVPSRLTPWALSTATIWIDKTGINQESSETAAAGVAAFPRILQASDKFVGLISPGYFRRLW